MKRNLILSIALASICLAWPYPCRVGAGEKAVCVENTADTKAPATKEADDKKPDTSDLTVAILDFDSSAGDAKLGKQVSEVLTATLSGETGFVLVDRSTLARTLQEHELTLTGLVNADQATKIGKLVGARILVTGKIFPIDKQLFLTAKLIGTETSLVDGVLVKGDQNADVGDLMMKLSEKVAARLREAGPKLVAQPDAGKDPLPELKKQLTGRKLPIVAIHIQERHVTAGPVAHVDPAVEAELRGLFEECGFKVIDGDAAQEVEGGVNLIVSGEAFSEFAARIGNLVSCSARVEVKISNRKTGEVLFSDRETTRGVDLAENIAGKTALQKAGHIVGIRIVQNLADKLGEKQKKKGN